MGFSRTPRVFERIAVRIHTGKHALLLTPLVYHELKVIRVQDVLLSILMLSKFNIARHSPTSSTLSANTRLVFARSSRYKRKKFSFYSSADLQHPQARPSTRRSGVLVTFRSSTPAYWSHS
jgi:hypothetical protein